MNKRNEKISAFLDNGIHSDELMSFSLSAEADDAKVAQRYQMVGEALRGELSSSSFIDVSQAVSEALANENIADEHTVAKMSAATRPTTDSNEKMSTGFFDWSSLFRPAAGMAMAAFVAVVMVFSLSEKGDDFSPNSVAVQESSPGIANVATTQPVSAQPDSIPPALIQQGQEQFRTVANVPAQPTQINTSLNPVAGMANDKTEGDRATKMSPYINQHLEFARQETLQGRMPYVRAVSFENKTQ